MRYYSWNLFGFFNTYDVHVLKTFVSLSMVYAHFCAHLRTHMYIPWALRPLIQQEYLSSVLQGFSYLCLSSPGIAGKYHQPKHLAQMLQMINTSLQVWITSTSWLESFAHRLSVILKWTKIILLAWVFVINCLAPFRMRSLSFTSLCCLPSYFPALLMPKVLLPFSSFFMPTELLSFTMQVNDVGIYLFLPKETQRKLGGFF